MSLSVKLIYRSMSMKMHIISNLIRITGTLMRFFYSNFFYCVCYILQHVGLLCVPFTIVTKTLGVQWLHFQLQERLIQRSRALTRLDTTVTKWKDSLEKQRRNVYNNHSMLSWNTIYWERQNNMSNRPNLLFWIHAPIISPLLNSS